MGSGPQGLLCYGAGKVCLGLFWHGFREGAVLPWGGPAPREIPRQFGTKWGSFCVIGSALFLHLLFCRLVCFGLVWCRA